MCIRDSCSLAGLVSIGEYDHGTNVFRKIESPKSRCRQCRPCWMTGRLHCGEAALDTLADHQHVTGRGKAHGTAAAWTKHHLFRFDRGFACSVTRKISSV